MIKRETKYRTRDGKFFNDRSDAIDHCLDQAAVRLKNFMNDCGLDFSYGKSVVAISYIEKIGDNKLGDVADWIEDALSEEDTDY